MLKHLAPFYVGRTKFHLNWFGGNFCPMNNVRSPYYRGCLATYNTFPHVHFTLHYSHIKVTIINNWYGKMKKWYWKVKKFVL